MDMKKLFYFNCMRILMAIIFILPNIHIASGQSADIQQSSIPENINMIFQASCLKCHGNNGGRLPKSKLNFSRWVGYGSAKQTEKALLICSTLRKAKMPPKSKRDSSPGLIPTKEQVVLICAWAESLKPSKEKK
jgi:hypothetical protein